DLRVGGEEAADRLSEPVLPQEQAEAATGLADVVADHGQVSAAGGHERFDQAQRLPHQAEAPHHDDVAIANASDGGGGVLEHGRHALGAASGPSPTSPNRHSSIQPSRA